MLNFALRQTPVRFANKPGGQILLLFDFLSLFLPRAIAETPPKNATISTAAFSPVFKYRFPLNLYYNITSFLVFIRMPALSFASCSPSLHVPHITPHYTPPNRERTGRKAQQERDQGKRILNNLSLSAS